MGKLKWTKTALEFFIEEGNLSELDEKILRTRAKRMTRVEQLDTIPGLTMSTLDRHIRDIKDLYDIVQKQHPDILPVRFESDEEKYMDTATREDVERHKREGK